MSLKEGTCDGDCLTARSTDPSRGPSSLPTAAGRVAHRKIVLIRPQVLPYVVIYLAMRSGLRKLDAALAEEARSVRKVDRIATEQLAACLINWRYG